MLQHSHWDSWWKSPRWSFVSDHNFKKSTTTCQPLGFSTNSASADRLQNTGVTPHVCIKKAILTESIFSSQALAKPCCCCCVQISSSGIEEISRDLWEISEQRPHVHLWFLDPSCSILRFLAHMDYGARIPWIWKTKFRRCTGWVKEVLTMRVFFRWSYSSKNGSSPAGNPWGNRETLDTFA